MYKNKITQAILLGGLSLTLAGCGDKTAEQPVKETKPAEKVVSTESTYADVQELTRGNGTEVATLDPHKSQEIGRASCRERVFRAV